MRALRVFSHQARGRLRYEGSSEVTYQMSEEPCCSHCQFAGIHKFPRECYVLQAELVKQLVSLVKGLEARREAAVNIRFSGLSDPSTTSVQEFWVEHTAAVVRQIRELVSAVVY